LCLYSAWNFDTFCEFHIMLVFVVVGILERWDGFEPPTLRLCKPSH
jgi:hypothetical protein